MKIIILAVSCVHFFISPSLAQAKNKDKDFIGSYESWKSKPSEAFKSPKKNFEMAFKLLKQKHYKQKLSDSDLYRAATAGMLESLNKDGRQWNKLISPSEMLELQVDLKGEVSGIGIVLKFDSTTGVSNIVDVIDGSPAQKSGIEAGDQLLSVGGKRYKGKQFRDVVYDIRGKVGSKIQLKILRGLKVVSKTVARNKIAWSPVKGRVIEKDTGLLTISYFSDTSKELINKELEKFKKSKVKRLVVDLRNNSGGVFKEALGSLDLFIEKNKIIAKIEGRNGKIKSILSRVSPVLKKLPVAVLINGQTTSGAELFAGSLQESLDAKVIGEATFGKWSAQMVQSLGNQFAIKYTVQVFQTPSGKTYQGTGLEPEVRVSGDDVSESRHILPKKGKVPLDPQMKTAVSLLKLIS